jgi:hypothetical protein
MKEKVFNLFVYSDGTFITQLGVAVHEIDGSDEEKMEFLQNSVYADYLLADIANIRSCMIGTSDGQLKYSSYMALARVGRSFQVFEDFFARFDAPHNPLCCITPIINGEPQLDMTLGHEPFYVSSFEDHPKLGKGKMADFLESYTTEDGFDLPRLINDDYFNAIKLLFRSKYYVSCMKLIVSFIDTISYLEFGDISGGFVEWLNLYMSMEKLGITELQLWEHRNSILHMSNLDSRKVLAGKEKRISFCVARSGYIPAPDLDIVYFNLADFIQEMAQALSRWIQTFQDHPNKMLVFIERYDRVISDSRGAITNIQQEA